MAWSADSTLVRGDRTLPTADGALGIVLPSHGGLTRIVSPQIVSFGAVASTGQIALAWTYRDTQPPITASITRAPAFVSPVVTNSSGYIDSGLTAGQLYTYDLALSDARGLNAVGAQTSGTPPAVSGSLTHGQSATVTGTGFGTRSDYNVGNYTWQGVRHIHYRWNDFANAFPPNGSSQATYLADNAMKGFQPSIQEDFASSTNLQQKSGGPSQSGKYMSRTGSGFASEGSISILSDNASPVPTSPQGYFCFKQRMTLPPNGKYFRWWKNGQGGGFYTRPGFATRDYNGASDIVGDGGPDTPTFTRSEWFIHPTATYNRVGQTIVHWGGRFGWPLPSDTIPLFAPTDTMRDGWWMWMDALDSGVVGEVADIYFDWTAARVEINQGSVAEIQILTSWSATSIAYRFNKGQLASGAATLKVYNASDVVIFTMSVTVA